MDGFGNINWWGFSPSIDILKLYDQNIKNNEDTVNILLMNCGDQRIIIDSLKSKKNLGKKIRFFVYEKMLELYARDLLLLSIIFEHSQRSGVGEKAENFLEIYGNLLIRESTANLIRLKSSEFIKFITDLDYLAKSSLNMFNFSLLKYKERDFLEGIFKFWRIKEANKEYFPAEKCWDVRLRNYFANRYDSRSNAYDWDFSMKLLERKNCSIINHRVYSKWRDSGIAFEQRDVNYDTPNKTLASGMIFNDPRSGDKASRRGYFGDIIVGPYLAYGIQHENVDFFKKVNDSYRYTATDIAKSNLESLIGKIVEIGGHESVESKLSEMKIVEVGEEVEMSSDDYFKLEDVEIVFLPLSAVGDFSQKNKFDGFFDAVFVGNSAAANLADKSFSKILKAEALVVVETAKYMIEMKTEQINGFSQKLRQMCHENGFLEIDQNICNVKESKDNLEFLDHLIFLKNK
ncbi:dynein assembly factor axonemal [Brachionus plicatilis]|uniref:Dynein assembly factor axonemal n=1 Tax=Brachionus plicatilis TaxID=10195 RepID=A0A3M7T3R6_BRAPC|nr:dynein assembly factor axonemal [Brachionus plicatilis]